VRSEQPARDAALGLAPDGIRDAAIEALNEAIGLRPVGSGEAVLNALACAKLIEWMLARGLVGRLVLLVDGEAVGELGAIVGENGVHRMREVGQEALQEPFRRLGIPLWMKLHVDVACDSIDGDEGVVFAPLQRRQVLEIDVDEANGRLLENTDSRLVRFRAPAQAVPLQTTMNGAARQLAVDAASHHLDDIVERQLSMRPQFTDQRLFHRREADHQLFWRVGTVAYRGAGAPAADRGLADAEFDRQLGDRLLAALDVGADLRGGCGIGVQVQFHDARRSLT
jgi:hypothetical protein